MLTIAEPLQTMINTGIHYFCSCWRIERTDGVTLLFTDHDSALVILGETFQPAGSFNASARQKTSGLKEHNMDLVGVLDSTAITHEDLRAGRYREAKVTEYVLDWRYPWAGTICTVVWWIGDTTFEDDRWRAQVTGLTRWFDQAIGRVYGRLCNWNLGDTNCTLDIDALTLSPVTVATVDSTYPRKKFLSTGLIGNPATLWPNGRVVWLTGNNAGIAGEVKTFNTVNGELVLYLSMPFDVQVGDTYSLAPGCDKRHSTCFQTFNNIINFGGFPFVPGTDASLQYPDAHI